jgi:diaminohydroxyphosphoribosylaminopyrimidine deaminase / 5-amino-6-(5-phosphoribosylamino)uracil reductase
VTGTPEATAAEVEAMRRAIALAARGLGTTSPNPVVGCVIVAADGTVAGEGWHERAGGPHAEVHALAAAGDGARGGTAVVTLEPCDHTGRTGPCSRALIDAGIRRVVFAVADPNGAAAGGASTLRTAGVEVLDGVLADEATRMNRAWLHSVRTGRPFVRWKFAATLDGRSAAADGTSRWITSPESRADVHRWRSQADAVLAGIGTVLADDPQLTVRTLPDGTEPLHQPVRVVLDADGRTPPTARVRDGAAPTIVLTAEEVGRGPAGVGVDLAASLAHLYGRGVRSVFLEGGPRLAGAFLDAGLVDEVVAYLAPAVLGQGAAALATREVGSTIASILRLDVDEITMSGPDIRLVARPVPRR